MKTIELEKAKAQRKIVDNKYRSSNPAILRKGRRDNLRCEVGNFSSLMTRFFGEGITLNYIDNPPLITKIIEKAESLSDLIYIDELEKFAKTANDIKINARLLKEAGLNIEKSLNQILKALR